VHFPFKKQHQQSHSSGKMTKRGANAFSGWWLTYPSEKYEFVSWDDDTPNMMEK